MSEGGNTSMIANALKVLHPKRYTSFHDNPNDSMNQKQQRFSTLLLEHGEQELQDWGVIVRSTTRRRGHEIGSGSSRSLGSSASASALASGSNSATFAISLDPSTSTSTSINGHSHNRRNKRSNARKEREPSCHMKSVPGRLRLCSKSLMFEPNDMSRGIIRLPFDKMMDPPTNEASLAQNDQHENDLDSYRIITLRTKRFTVMRKNNIIAPYETIEQKVTFSFTFQHSSTKTFLELLNQVYDCQSQSQSDEKLQEMIKPMCDQPFDPSNFVSMNEVPLTDNLRAFILGPFPLVKKAGCAVITKKTIYFQPFNGVHSKMANKALSWSMDDIVAISRRYHGLKDEALEIFFEEGASVLFAFEGFQNREDIIRLLPTTTTRKEGGEEMPLFCHTDRSFLRLVVKAWSNGNIDNFEYLLALNSAAGRSLFDLSRYPIFPWVLADYKSSKLDLSSSSSGHCKDGPLRAGSNTTFRDLTKPIGALNKERLNSFKARLKYMDDMESSFLYGTHYSAPGYCLYYLVRNMPEQMLCLQNGKYDAPERLFQSVEQSFASLLTNQADIKESIPQFYDAKGGADFLLNTRGLQLGITQNGVIIDDVELPKWAKSPKDFLKKNRKALESDYCTRFLPSWIDLIFGINARGEKALAADNLFHPTAYLSPKDYDQMETEAEKFQAELQAVEFGICPDVLFSSPHPQKHNDKETSDDSLIAHLGRDATQTSFRNNATNGTKLQRVRVSSPVTTQSDSHDKEHLSPMRSMMKFAQQISESASTSRDGALSEITSTSKDSFDLQKESSNEIIEINASDYSFDGPGSSEFRGRKVCLSGTGESRGDDASGTGTFGPDEPRMPTIKSAMATESKPDRRNSTHTKEGWHFKPVTSKHMHGGAVSGCHLSLGSNPCVITTSLDGGLMVHLLPSVQTKGSRRRSFSSGSSRGLSSNRKVPVSGPQQFQTLRSHQSSDPLSCLAILSDKSAGTIAFTGGHDDVILAYGINSACGLASVYSHRDVVAGLVLINNTSADAGLRTHIMLSGSWDASVKLWNVTINEGEVVRIAKDPIAELYDAESSVNCIDALRIPQVGLLIAAGGTDGSLIVWLWTFDGNASVIFKDDTRSGNHSCSTVKWSENKGGTFLFAGFGNGRVSSFSFHDNVMYPVSKLNLGSPVGCLAVVRSASNHDIFVGCADGSLKCVAVDGEGHFEFTELESWSSVNGSDSSGITSISVVSTADKPNRYSITSGADDGSVALYLIERVP